MVGFYVNAKVGLFHRHLSFLSLQINDSLALQTLWEILSATWQKPQTFRETTFARRGNAKPFGK